MPVTTGYILRKNKYFQTRAQFCVINFNESKSHAWEIHLNLVMSK